MSELKASKMATAQARNFHHPYQPYDIQLEFMSTLYDCLDNGQVGIFESPTAVKGKSLSIICGALTWLRDSQESELAGGADVDDEDEPAWVVEHARNERIQRALDAKKDLEARLAQIRKKEQQQKRRFERGEPPHKKAKTDAPVGPSEADDDEAFALDDYESDGETGKIQTSSSNGLSGETVKLLERAGMVLKSEAPDEEALNVGTKIFFCSRTHSQLTQFANEVRRVSIPIVSPSTLGDPDDDPDILIESVKLLSLGSRKNLCINPRVAKLGSATTINERCLELQQPKTPKDKKCPFVPTKEAESLVHDFRDHALAAIRDIEDLGRLGKEIEVCPYYASRAAIKPSEIVTLPYPLLLQKSARDALGISLKGHIVVIDEAHNLMNAIESIYSVTLTLNQLTESRLQLTTYLQKFRNKLKGKNRVYVAQVIRLLDSLIAYLSRRESQGGGDGVIDTSDLMSGKGIDQINLHKLCHYLQESKLARKVAGYTTFATQAEAREKPGQYGMHKIDAASPVLMLIDSFFQAMANPTAEGRFFHERDESGQRLRYMLLDPSQHFREVVEDARAVVLAGGTMSPMDDYIHYLFPYLGPERIRTLSCGHVIPKENLFAAPVTHFNGIELDFTFGKRNSAFVLNALGGAVVKLAETIPDGLVVFFPSYAYLDQVLQHWKRKESGTSSLSTFDCLSVLKRVFSESKDTSVDALFSTYAAHVNGGQDPASPGPVGAILFAVIGGKLSEGINFSDALGRGVAVVGLPFPNAQSAEWRTKLQYIETSAVSRGQTVAEGKALSRGYYENACMRAVNQSIGRAIRHKGDWAGIMLLDRRWSSPRVAGKLPGWIRDGMLGSEGQGEPKAEAVVWSKMGEFFAGKKG